MISYLALSTLHPVNILLQNNIGGNDVFVGVNEKRNILPALKKGGLQLQDSNRANLVSHPADHLDPSPFESSKPQKVGTSRTSLQGSENHQPISKKSGIAVRFQDFNILDESTPLISPKSPLQNQESATFSPQTPGVLSRKNYAGHTPFKADTSAVSFRQDSFMEVKFKHDYRMNRDYDHDYSMLNKTSSTASVISITPQIQPRNQVTFREESSDENILQDLLQFQSDSPSSDDSPIPKERMNQHSYHQSDQQTYEPSPSSNTPLSSISQPQSVVSNGDYSMTNGLSASFLLKEDVDLLSGDYPDHESNREEKFMPLSSSSSSSRYQISAQQQTPYQPLRQTEESCHSTSINADLIDGTIKIIKSETKVTSNVKKSEVPLPIDQHNITISEELFSQGGKTSMTTFDTNTENSQIFDSHRPSRKMDSDILMSANQNQIEIAAVTDSSEVIATFEESKVKDFDMEYFRALKDGYLQGKISKSKSLELMNIFYDLQETSNPSMDVFEKTEEKTFLPIERVVPTTISRLTTITNRNMNTTNTVLNDLDSNSISRLRRPSSAPRSQQTVSPQEFRSYHVSNIRDESVDPSVKNNLTQREKESMNDIIISPNPSSIHDMEDGMIKNSRIVGPKTPFHRVTKDNTKDKVKESRMNSPSTISASSTSQKRSNVISMVNSRVKASTPKPQYHEDEISGYVADGTICLDSTLDTSSIVEENISRSKNMSQISVAKSQINNNNGVVTTAVSTTSLHINSHNYHHNHLDQNDLGKSPGISLSRPSFMLTKARSDMNHNIESQSKLESTNQKIYELDQSQTSLPYLGNNEPSFAKKLSNQVNTNSNQASSTLETKSKSQPQFQSSPLSSNLQSLESSPQWKNGIDVSIQCPSIPNDSPLSSLTSNNLSMNNNNDSSNNELAEHELSDIMKHLHHTIIRHNLQVPWQIAAPTPTSTNYRGNQTKISKPLWSTANTSAAVRVPKNGNDDDEEEEDDDDSMNNSNHNHDSCNEGDSYDFESMDNVFNMKDTYQHNNDDDSFSMTSTIDTSSSYASVPSVIHDIIQEASGYNYRPVQSLRHTINQKPFSPHHENRTEKITSSEKKSFDVHAVTFNKSINDQIQPMVSKSLPNSNIKKILVNQSEQKNRKVVETSNIHDDNNNDRDVSNNVPLHPIQESVEVKQGEYEYNPENDDSGIFTSATTMTFESTNPERDEMNYTQEESKIGNNSDINNAPKLVIASKCRSRKSLPESMKEINLVAKPGGYTTVVLTFSNKRSSIMNLYPAIIQTRFDTIGGTKNSKLDTTGYGLDLLPNLQAFQVSPHKLYIHPGEETTLYVTFTPSHQYEGIYTGALKIKSKKKSFVILLRGEAFYEEGDRIHATVDGVGVATPTSTNAVIDQSIHNISKINDTTVSFISSQYTNKSVIKPISKAITAVTDSLFTLASQNETKRVISSVSNKDSKHSMPLDTFMSPSVVYQSYSNVKDSSIGEVDRINSIKRDTIQNPLNSPDSVNTTVLADALISLNKMADDFIHNAKSSTFHSESHHRMLNRGEYTLYDFIVRPEYPSSKVQQHYQPPHQTSEPSIHRSNEDVDVLDLRRKYLKDWISCCKVATKGLSKYPNITAIATKENNSENIKSFQNNQSNHKSKSDFNNKSNIQSLNHFHDENNENNRGNNSNSNNGSNSSGNSFIMNSQVSKRSTGVFFRQENVQFGSIEVGSLTRVKLELCNATDNEVRIIVGDPSLPFVILHNDITIRPRSYVRLPVRFVPTAVSTYSIDLIAQTDDGKFCTNIRLHGTSF